MKKIHIHLHITQEQKKFLLDAITMERGHQALSPEQYEDLPDREVKEMIKDDEEHERMFRDLRRQIKRRQKA